MKNSETAVKNYENYETYIKKGEQKSMNNYKQI